MAKTKNGKSVASDPRPSMSGGDSERILNVHPDLPDIRDRMYEPALLDLDVSRKPPDPAINIVLDQGQEGACTGFALAGAINNLRHIRCRRQGLPPDAAAVSPRMLYEMAKLHDEWPGEAYDGSSIRGSLKGFFHNGACSDALAPYDARERGWHLTVEQAKDARNVALGAYYRLRPEIIDYHSALNEVGVVIVSAHVHRGWQNPKDGIIRKSQLHTGGHAFMIVGYDETGFLIQNSWGPAWGGFQGNPGIAHWSYRDWAENIIDAWVLRLAVPTPEAFDLTHIPVRKDTAAGAGIAAKPVPRRHDILGHFIHIDDGDLVTTGRYATDLDSIAETGRFLVADGNKPAPSYDHLLLYAHGGLNSAKASARRVLAMKDVFKRNRIYPVHFMWETGFTEELGDIFADIFKKSEERVGFARDALDWTIEKAASGVGRRLWRQMKVDAERAFAKKAGGTAAVAALLDANAQRGKPMKVHLVGHSAGSILLGECLKTWSSMSKSGTGVSSLSLMAPACTLSFYDKAYGPALGKGAQKGIVDKLYQYNLIDTRELDDTVGPYGKSLLYFVSNAFEESRGEPLLGMEIFANTLKLPKNHKLWYAGRDTGKTDSKVHGGFDNDRLTMNDVLANVLGKKPKPTDAFQEHEMIGY
ncbi:C1 family peptidase [Roseibium sp.]|uniref:C1 family peptidase n=1 Tax=Roseibium sp. TaxID=1936156 RepID=UPI003A97FF9B